MADEDLRKLLEKLKNQLGDQGAEGGQDNTGGSPQGASPQEQPEEAQQPKSDFGGRQLGEQPPAQLSEADLRRLQGVDSLGPQQPPTGEQPPAEIPSTYTDMRREQGRLDQEQVLSTEEKRDRVLNQIEAILSDLRKTLAQTGEVIEKLGGVIDEIKK